MPFGISFHSSGIHPGSFHLAEAHPVEESHPSGSKPAGNDIEKPGSPAVASGHDPFPPSSTGLPSGSSPVKSVLHDIKLPDDPSHYVIKTPDKNGDYELFKRDEATDTPIDTGQKMRFGGQGGWEKVSNPDVAKPATSPTLPPAAKIGADDLGELNGEGLFPDGKGNQFGRIGENLYQMKYDHQLEGHRAVDPKKPNTFQGSVPVKLDGKGGAEPLPKAANKGGGGPQLHGNTLREQLNRARQDEQDAQRRVDTAQAALDHATQRTHDFSPRYLADEQRVERISDDILAMDRERQQLQQSLRHEPNPERREHLQQRIDSVTRRIDSADRELLLANNASDRSHQQHTDNLRQENQAIRNLMQSQQDLHAAVLRVQQLQSLAQATPSLGR